MLVIDELKKNDPALRLVAVALAVGLLILIAGLWWVQVVSSRAYQSHLETQSYRTIRLPAVRGKILDREGRVLAENRPSYNLVLYLDELRDPFYNAYTNLLASVRAAQRRNLAAFEKKLGRPPTKAELKQFQLNRDYLAQLREEARDLVAGGIVTRLGQTLGQPLALDVKKFNRHYARQLALPYPALDNLNATQMARFEEHYDAGLGADLEPESVRNYPNGTTAGHLLGYLLKNDSSSAADDTAFNYRLEDFHGVVGVEAGFDSTLRGRAGEESVLVNSLGYRHSETIETPPAPGRNVVLTLDLDLQRAAEQSVAAHRGADARAAVVVLDVRNGDVLVMASSPAFNPIFSENDPAQLADDKLRPEINRATQENYAPGSIFKPIVALAALEAGLNPDALVDNPGYVYVGRRHIRDLAPPGQYNLRRAIIHSSNTYFITVGLRAGIDNIIQLAQKFCLGQHTDLPTRQDGQGHLPTLERVHHDWRDGDTANICIGQGEIAVTPLQMAVVYAAIANGGTVYWPRLVKRIEPQDPASSETITNFPTGIVRSRIGVSTRNLNILRSAMLAETEDPEGTGHAAVVGPEMRICGKTGTAQVMNEHNQEIDRTTWFASFAPYEHPRYAVVVMVESGTYGGPTCAPIAHDIYEAIVREENAGATKSLAAR